MTDRIQRFNYSVDLLRAVLWQFNDASRLQSLLSDKSAWYEEHNAGFWDDWERDVFNMLTANDFGLAVWGIILDTPLSFGLPGSGARPVFGFGNFNRNFFDGTFGRDSSGVAGLTLEQKRLILRLRYFQLISDGSVTHINYVLKEVFGDGRVLDGYDMTASYVFSQALPSSILTLLDKFDLLPRPAGVEIDILIDPADVFGFDPFYQNFNNGGFGA